MSAGYNILEHTADLGIRAWGATREQAFEQAARGLIDVMGARARMPIVARTVKVEGTDAAAVLVDFLNELIVLHEIEEAGFGRVRVLRVSDSELEAEVEMAPLDGRAGGTTVKAATYHQLEVREGSGRVEADVYLDV